MEEKKIFFVSPIFFYLALIQTDNEQSAPNLSPILINPDINDGLQF